MSYSGEVIDGHLKGQTLKCDGEKVMVPKLPDEPSYRVREDGTLAPLFDAVTYHWHHSIGAWSVHPPKPH